MTLLYEDGAVTAHLKHDGAALGHIVVSPKQPAKVLGDLPESVAVQLWYCASFAATAVYEGLGAHGTNIVCYEGERVELHVLPRQPQDGLSLMWDGARADPAELERVASKVQDKLWYVGKQQERPASPITASSVQSQEAQPTPFTDTGSNPATDQRIVHLQRRP